MQLGKFRVHRMSAHRSPMPVMHDGEELMADVHTTEMELTCEDGRHGSLILRFVKAADRQLADAWSEGDTLTLEAKKCTPAKEKAEPEA
jgi:hypothetical protein